MRPYFLRKCCVHFWHAKPKNKPLSCSGQIWTQLLTIRIQSFIHGQDEYEDVIFRKFFDIQGRRKAKVDSLWSLVLKAHNLKFMEFFINMNHFFIDFPREIYRGTTMECPIWLFKLCSASFLKNYTFENLNFIKTDSFRILKR